MARQTFSASVDAWCLQGIGRVEEVFKQATQNVFEDVIDGTPRDTGFLVNSFTVTTDGTRDIDPEAFPAPGTERGAFEPKPYAAVIEGAEVGSVVTGSFTAAYSGFIEYGAEGRPARGMVRLAVQRWQEHVDKAVETTKAIVAKRLGS